MNLPDNVQLDQIRAKAAEHFNGKDGFANAERLNAYECDGEKSFREGVPDKDGCGHYIVTIDREPGVTPFIVRCGNCGMSARSKGYKVASYLTPTHEWYRPDCLRELTEWELEHVKKGGLLLRPIDDAKWLAPGQHQQDQLLAAMKKAMADEQYDMRKEAAAKTLSRQAVRHEKRKHKTVPETVTMYGRTYRLIS
jgi:hypothetical protein